MAVPAAKEAIDTMLKLHDFFHFRFVKASSIVWPNLRARRVLSLQSDAVAVKGIKNAVPRLQY